MENAIETIRRRRRKGAICAIRKRGIVHPGKRLNEILWVPGVCTCTDFTIKTNERGSKL